ncbi:MAG: putative signal transduction protein with EAL and GGDEF domain [Gammaproteobacteria bacterium]
MEEWEQFELLKDLGCDAIQGFLIAKPMPSDQLENILLNPSQLINFYSKPADSDTTLKLAKSGYA